MPDARTECPLNALQNDLTARAMQRVIAAEQAADVARQRAFAATQHLADVLNLLQDALQVPSGWVLTDDQPYRFVPPKS